MGLLTRVFVWCTRVFARYTRVFGVATRVFAIPTSFSLFFRENLCLFRDIMAVSPAAHGLTIAFEKKLFSGIQIFQSDEITTFSSSDG